MKLPPATLLIIAMFGSFVVILAVMIAVFRPEPRSTRRLVSQTDPMMADTLKRVTPPEMDTLGRADTVKKSVETSPPVAASTKPKVPIPKTAEAGRRLYRDLERERKEMAALRIGMERRLKEAQKDHTQKLAQLARRCGPLEPGEAVQILTDLRDPDIATVLRHMKSDRAAPIMALLKRLGRENAINLKK